MVEIKNIYKRITVIIFLWAFLSITNISNAQEDTLWIYTFPSADNLKVSVKSNIIRSQDIFVYRYILSNNTESQQNIESFFLDYCSNIFSVNNPADWYFLFSSTRHSIMWFAEDSLSFISPNQVLYGFRFSSEGIPTIATFYVRGFRIVEEFEYGYTPDVVKGGNVFENSFKGLTVAPKDPPSPFNSLNFLDTLKSYTTQSRSLGWIADQQAANKYLEYFDSAKAQIQQNRYLTAGYTLDTILAHADRDSSGLLTSEAYALIRFNTEYLIEQLFEKK